MKTLKFTHRVASALPLAVVLLCFPAAAYEESGVTGGPGTVKGKVTFTGPLPVDAVEKIAITKNPDVCGEGDREVVWVDVKDAERSGAPSSSSRASRRARSGALPRKVNT